MVGEQLKIMKHINHMPGTLEACVTRKGTLVGPVQTDITGFAEITPYKGGWCGNDANPRIFNQRVGGSSPSRGTRYFNDLISHSNF